MCMIIIGFRGLEGFGAPKQLHPAKILRLLQGLSMVIEIADAKEKTRPFLKNPGRGRRGGVVASKSIAIAPVGRTGPVRGRHAGLRRWCPKEKVVRSERYEKAV